MPSGCCFERLGHVRIFLVWFKTNSSNLGALSVVTRFALNKLTHISIVFVVEFNAGIVLVSLMMNIEDEPVKK